MTRAPLERWLHRGAEVLAIGYPATLFVIVLVLRFVGERWWLTGLALYLPRIGFAAPLPVVVLLLLALGRWRLLAVQIVSGLLLSFPLMGFTLPGFASATKGAPAVRILSYNTNSAIGGEASVLAEVDRFSPDVVLFQEIGGSERKFVEDLSSRYPTIRASGQFVLASRYPLVSKMEPGRIPYYGVQRSPRFTEQVLDTPLGKIAFYNVHPISPREGFAAIRAAGLRREVLTGRFFLGLHASILRANNGLRRLQVEAIAELASHETYPVVIAGDTNLPSLSETFGRYLSNYADGFAKAGWGLGYTFPANRRHPWMRLDRVLASAPLRFVGFETGTSQVSDHRCVVADIQRE